MRNTAEPRGDGGRLEPWATHALELAECRIARVRLFTDATLFPHVGHPGALAWDPGIGS